MLTEDQNAFFGSIIGDCLYRPNPFVYYGPYYQDDTDCTGLCCQSLQRAEDYINKQGDGGFYQDALNTINDIMGTPQANGRDQFFLYINGYVQFFNEDTDGCDDWTFVLFPDDNDANPNEQTVVKSLRIRMNSLVTNLNQVYQNAINDWQPDISRDTQQYAVYVDVDPFFNNHRFCEPGDTFQDQWTGSNVWIWNLQIDNAQDQAAADSGDTAGLTELHVFESGDENGPRSGWQSRPFHPKYRGHTAIKDAIIAKMRASGMPGVKPAPPYVPGQCGFHLQERWASRPSRTDGPAYITIAQLVDGAGNKIGFLDRTEIKDNESVSLTSALPYVVVITPWDSGEDWDSWNYYNIHFAYAGKDWDTFTDTGDAHCTVGGRAPTGDGSGFQTQDMDCVFPC